MRAGTENKHVRVDPFTGSFFVGGPDCNLPVIGLRMLDGSEIAGEVWGTHFCPCCMLCIT
jgi:hypothetical protein